MIGTTTSCWGCTAVGCPIGSRRGQALLASYRCSLFCGRALFSEEFVERVYSAWPRTRHEAENVITGLYLAMREVLQHCEASLAVQELLDYEALAVVDLRVRPSLALPWTDDLPAAEWEGVEVYRFDHAVTQIHARTTLYAGSAAPARFVRELSTQPQSTLVSRRRMPNGWALADVTQLLTAANGDSP
jgi:hypothetical protein